MNGDCLTAIPSDIIIAVFKVFSCLKVLIINKLVLCSCIWVTVNGRIMRIIRTYVMSKGHRNDKKTITYHHELPLPVLAFVVNSCNRIITAIRKHIAAEEALAGGGVGVGVYEAAGGGVVVAGL